MLPISGPGIAVVSGVAAGLGRPSEVFTSALCLSCFGALCGKVTENSFTRLPYRPWPDPSYDKNIPGLYKTFYFELSFTKLILLHGKQLTEQKREAQNLSIGAHEVIADETVIVEVIFFLAYTLETAVAEVQRATASFHRAGEALGDLCSKQTWCSD